MAHIVNAIRKYKTESNDLKQDFINTYKALNKLLSKKNTTGDLVATLMGKKSSDILNILFPFIKSYYRGRATTQEDIAYINSFYLGNDGKLVNLLADNTSEFGGEEEQDVEEDITNSVPKGYDPDNFKTVSGTVIAGIGQSTDYSEGNRQRTDNAYHGTTIESSRLPVFADVTLEVRDEDNIPFMQHDANGNPTEVTTWGEAKKGKSVTWITHNIPIAIIHEGKQIGWVHTREWVNQFNIAHERAGADNLPAQQKRIEEQRQAIVGTSNTPGIRKAKLELTSNGFINTNIIFKEGTNIRNAMPIAMETPHKFIGTINISQGDATIEYADGSNELIGEDSMISKDPTKLEKLNGSSVVVIQGPNGVPIPIPLRMNKVGEAKMNDTINGLIRNILSGNNVFESAEELRKITQVEKTFVTKSNMADNIKYINRKKGTASIAISKDNSKIQFIVENGTTISSNDNVFKGEKGIDKFIEAIKGHVGNLKINMNIKAMREGDMVMKVDENDELS